MFLWGHTEWILFPEKVLFQMVPYNGHISSVSPETVRTVQMMFRWLITSIHPLLSLLNHPSSLVFKTSGNNMNLNTKVWVRAIDTGATLMDVIFASWSSLILSLSDSQRELPQSEQRCTFILKEFTLRQAGSLLLRRGGAHRQTDSRRERERQSVCHCLAARYSINAAHTWQDSSAKGNIRAAAQRHHNTEGKTRPFVLTDNSRTF